MPMSYAARGITTALAALLLAFPARGNDRQIEGTLSQGLSAGTQGMVATAHPLASLAALEILKKGGNAVDAAVAAAFAIGVVEPDGSGLGGGGGMLVYLAKEKRALYINYYQKASREADSVAYTPRVDAQTAKATLVPGTVAGLTLALERFGTLPLPTVIAPAIRYAEEGFPIDATLASILLDNVPLVQKHPATAAVYLRDGFPMMEGDTLAQPDLARTLRTVAAEGASGFYAGPVAHAIVDEVNRNGGRLTLEDLAEYTAEVVPPVRGTYRGYDVLSAPPPHSGVFVIEALNIVENENLRALGHYAASADALHLLAETERRVYADRTAFLADPHYERVPVHGLLDKAFARTRLATINRSIPEPGDYRKTPAGDPWAFDAAFPPSPEGPEDTAEPDTVEAPSVPVPPDGHEADGHTTHLCVIDRHGNTVSLSQTLGTFFGSGVTAAGVLLNNARSNFASTTRRNRVEPGKRPRSSISPTILLRDNKPFLAVGSPGATRIVATVFEVIVNVVDYGMSAGEANDAPRFLCMKLDDYLHVESRIQSEVRESLSARGHPLRVYGEYDLFFGGAQMILIDPVTGLLSGSADPRRGGAAAGY